MSAIGNASFDEAGSPPEEGIMERQQYLYTVKPTRPGFLEESTVEEDAIVAEHYAYLKHLCEAGDVLLAGRTLSVDEDSFGLVIFLADNEDVARQLMENDPAVRAGVFLGRLHPYRVALVHSSIAPQDARSER